MTCLTRGYTPIMTKLEEIRVNIGNVFADVTTIRTIVAETILVQMDQELDPDGVPWADLAPGYAAWKATVAPGSEMGRLTGLMKDIPNLMGRASGSPDTLTIAYGVDPLAIVHAIKFTEGGIVTGTSQPPRPFWGLNATSVARLDSHFHSSIIA